MKIPPEEPAHLLEGVDCWCEPTVEPVDPDEPDAGVIVVHRDYAERARG